MGSLFDDQPVASYAPIYESLGQLREEFHKTGRFDDSNAKLDEVVKLFATYLAVKLGDVEGFPAVNARTSSVAVPSLQAAFKKAAALPYYHRNDGQSIFGSNPLLALQESDAALAATLVRLVVRAVEDAFRHQDLGNPYDVLNEAFGHFVRDNFRGNIEDAQYLTPAEVIDLMVSVALSELSDRASEKGKTLVLADPCCGVGSFLTAFASRYRSQFGDSAAVLSLHGQDKVERMVRLTTVNLALFRIFNHSVTIGNSLYESPFDQLNGTVDLILTNPPFGARFNQQEVAFFAKDNTPLFSRLGQTRGLIESELLFIDRDLRLLREGGNLLIVVPDSVISAAGLPALLRHHLQKTATLRSVIELPSVTFAQAGTRTKTAILHLQKGADTPRPAAVFMAVSTDLGFQVSSRKGVQVKLNKGTNDLPKIFEAYRQLRIRGVDGPVAVLSEKPSAVAVPWGVLDTTWTPAHYQSARIHALNSMRDNSDIDGKTLGELVDFVADSRKPERHRAGSKFISVLHVTAEGLLDVGAIDEYAPITPGIPIFAGEVLLSRINPRIPRVTVVPDFAGKMLCSSEFEVMKPSRGLDPYFLAFLLLSRPVQTQIQSLTSGTSASHNRVKTRHLSNVIIPIPRPGSRANEELTRVVTEYKHIMESLLTNTQRLLALRQNETKWLQGDLALR